MIRIALPEGETLEIEDPLVERAIAKLVADRDFLYQSAVRLRKIVEQCADSGCKIALRALAESEKGGT